MRERLEGLIKLKEDWNVTGFMIMVWVTNEERLEAISDIEGLINLKHLLQMLQDFGYIKMLKIVD